MPQLYQEYSGEFVGEIARLDSCHSYTVLSPRSGYQRDLTELAGHLTTIQKRQLINYPAKSFSEYEVMSLLLRLVRVPI